MLSDLCRSSRASTSQTSTLRAFLAPGSSTETERTWKLVDWTNPTVEKLCGVYIGKGATDGEAIRMPFWTGVTEKTEPAIGILPESLNMKFGTDIKDTFLTTGATSWTTSPIFRLGRNGGGIVAIIAGVITAVAPVPGSQVVTGVIWGLMCTSAAAGIAAAGIRIGQRHDEGSVLAGMTFSMG